MLSQKETILERLSRELNYRILEYLLDKEDNVTNIANAINSTKARVSIALNELEDRKLVAKRVFGRSHVYKLNKLSYGFREIVGIIIQQKAEKLNHKLENLPKIVDSYLRSILKKNYLLAIFFGSVISENEYKDIDVYIVLKKRYDKAAELKKRLMLLNNKVAPIFGTIDELNAGTKNKDSLYANILNGLPSSDISKFIELKYNEELLKRNDIQERYALALRELHLELSAESIERAMFDASYAALNCLGKEPKNDNEVIANCKELKIDETALIKAKQHKLKQQDALEFVMKLNKVIYN